MLEQTRVCSCATLIPTFIAAVWSSFFHPGAPEAYLRELVVRSASLHDSRPGSLAGVLVRCCNPGLLENRGWHRRGGWGPSHLAYCENG